METEEMMENETIEIAKDEIEKLCNGCDSKKVAVASLGVLAIAGGMFYVIKHSKSKMTELKEILAAKKEERKKSKDYIRVKDDEIEYSSTK